MSARANRLLEAREVQIDDLLHDNMSASYCNQPATTGDILALEKTIILAGRQISEAIRGNRY